MPTNLFLSEDDYRSLGNFWQNALLLFPDIANSTVKFDDKGDGLGRYTIYNYQVDKDNKTDYKVKKKHHHVERENVVRAFFLQVVGKWFNGLNLNIEDIMWSFPEPSSSADAATLTPPSTTVTSMAASAPPLGVTGSSGGGGGGGDSALVSDVDGVMTHRPGDVGATASTPPHAPVTDPYDLIPTSVCSLPCHSGEIMIMSTVSRPRCFCSSKTRLCEK